MAEKCKENIIPFDIYFTWDGSTTHNSSFGRSIGGYHTTRPANLKMGIGAMYLKEKYFYGAPHPIGKLTSFDDYDEIKYDAFQAGDFESYNARRTFNPSK